jgi:hypothetical protein
MRLVNASIVFLALLMASVAAGGVTKDTIFVVGTIYDGNHNEVEGAKVLVTCHGLTREATSQADGDYWVQFEEYTPCMVNDPVTVTATKGTMTGTETDNVEEYSLIDLAIVDVTIPEFGTIAAAAALAGAGAVYFLRQKK